MVANYQWRFFRAGGFDQVKLTSGEDLKNLGQLDQKLWVALACPTAGLEFDPRTAALIDTDHDGRIRAPELLAAVSFACRNLTSADDLLKGETALPLAAINDATDEGKALRAAARQLLSSRKKPEATTLVAEDFGELGAVFNDTAFNGDGIIIPESASDEGLKTLIGEIGTAVGTAPDRSGKPGIGQAQIDAFWAAAEAYDVWWKQGEADPSVWPLGAEKTAAAGAAVAAIEAKVDDFFARCRLAAFDVRTAALANRKEEDYALVLAGEMSQDVSELKGFPLASVGAGRALPLAEGTNPAYASAVATLRRDAVGPLLGDRSNLTESDWIALKGRLAAHATWRAAAQGASVAALGIARIRAVLAADPRPALAALIAQDKALEPEVAALENLERLVRYHRDLYQLCINFVSFKDFYDGGEPAIFQSGTLYLDQRSCLLCLPVDDPARHAAMAGLAGAYLDYLDCVRKETNEKRQIVAAFTAGDSDNLMVGRNGIFYDRKGRDWDATITKIIDNPISVKQAIFAPYKKFGRFLEEQVAKRAAAAETDVHKGLDDTAKTAANVDKTKAAEAKKLDIGSVAALGVAFGAIGSFLTALIGYATGVLSLGPLATLGAILAVVAVISTPSVILAYLKLRKRNLGPILDANGWAINTRARINVPFGATLTEVAKLPRGARRDTRDRYAERSFPWKTLVVLFLLLYGAWSWYQGHMDNHLPKLLRSSEVLGDWAPRHDPPPPPTSGKAVNAR